MCVCWGVPVFPPSCTVAEPEAYCPSRSLPVYNSSLHELRLGIPAQEWDEKEGAFVCPWFMSLDTDPSGHTGQETSHSKPFLPLPSVHYSELNSLCTTEDGNWRSEPWRRAALGGLCFRRSTGPLDPCPECVGIESSPGL